MSLTIRQTRFSDEGDYQCFYNSPKREGESRFCQSRCYRPPTPDPHSEGRWFALHTALYRRPSEGNIQCRPWFR
uniref:Uncharacterized protein n=1 Tax=Anguilla anguilla TaxID=7936 RepID=A0A0E9Y1G1_ANGAN